MANRMLLGKQKRTKYCYNCGKRLGKFRVREKFCSLTCCEKYLRR